MWSDGAVVRKIPYGSDEFFGFAGQRSVLCPGHNDKNRKGVPIHRTEGDVVRQAVSAYKKVRQKGETVCVLLKGQLHDVLGEIFCQVGGYAEGERLGETYSGLGYVPAFYRSF